MKHDDLYMRIAHTIAAQSHCERSKVGAVIVRDDNIVAFGWNGTPPGFDNACELDGVTRPEVVHAEQNALAKAARSTVSTKGATLYCTVSPCYECAKSIIQAGIERVVYEEQYRDATPLAFILSAGVAVEQHISPLAPWLESVMDNIDAALGL